MNESFAHPVAIAAGSASVERRTKLFLVAVLVVWTGIDLSLSFPSRVAASGIEKSAIANLAIWLNLGGLFAFSVLVGAALYLRARSAIHKRLMLLHRSA